MENHEKFKKIVVDWQSDRTSFLRCMCQHPLQPDLFATGSEFGTISIWWVRIFLEFSPKFLFLFCYFSREKHFSSLFSLKWNRDQRKTTKPINSIDAYDSDGNFYFLFYFLLFCYFYQKSQNFITINFAERRKHRKIIRRFCKNRQIFVEISLKMIVWELQFSTINSDLLFSCSQEGLLLLWSEFSH